jgi:hypothetical protein
MKLYPIKVRQALLLLIIITPLAVWSQHTGADSVHLQKELNSTLKAGNVTLKFRGFVKLGHHPGSTKLEKRISLI